MSLRTAASVKVIMAISSVNPNQAPAPIQSSAPSGATFQGFAQLCQSLLADKTTAMQQQAETPSSGIAAVSPGTSGLTNAAVSSSLADGLTAASSLSAQQALSKLQQGAINSQPPSAEEDLEIALSVYAMMDSTLGPATAAPTATGTADTPIRGDEKALQQTEQGADATSTKQAAAQLAQDLHAAGKIQIPYDGNQHVDILGLDNALIAALGGPADTSNRTG